VQDRRFVLSRLTGVRGRLARIPLARLGGGVVERLVLDGVLTSLVVRLLERELDPVDQSLRIGPGCALQRQARVDRERLAAATACTGAAAAASAAAGSHTRGHASNKHAGYSQFKSSHGLSLL